LIDVFDDKKYKRALYFFKKRLHLTKGRWAGEPFMPFRWQRDRVIKPLYGTIGADGYRQYNTVYVEVPKKNGKSPLAAGIALELLFYDKEPGAEIYGAACDRDQASIVFDIAANMVRMSPELSAECKIIDSTKRIIRNNGSFYRVVSADAYSKHGFNAHGIIFDELHAQPNRELWDTLTEGAGDARTQPVIFAITTAGYDRNSICWEVHEYARQVQEGIIQDPTFLPVIYSTDEKDDWTSPKVWRKANPSLDKTITTKHLRQACQKAQEVPALENHFRRLRLNQWVKQESRYIPMYYWDQCGEPFDLDILHGRKCYAGLDLASTTDIAALVLAFRVDDLIYLLPRFWVPEETVRKRSKAEQVKYDTWVQQGYVKATPGNVIDYDYIENDIQQLGSEYQIQDIGFDPWGALQIAPHLTDKGFKVESVRQGYRTLSPPTKELLRLILAGQIKHGDNPVLRWMADNVMVTTDPAENVKPDKKKSTERIDGVVAAIMALDRLYRNEDQKFDVEIWAV